MKLKKEKIAIRAIDGFEECELIGSLKNPREEVTNTAIVPLHKKSINHWLYKNGGKEINSDISIPSKNTRKLDSLMTPIDIIDLVKIRYDDNPLKLVRDCIKKSKQKLVADFFKEYSQGEHNVF